MIDRASALVGKRFLLVASIALLAAGCGTKAYEERVEKGMGALNTAQMFLGISPTFTEIPGTNLKMRFPTFIDGRAKAYNEQSAEPDGKGVVNPLRLSPPFLKIPGLRVAYEMEGFDPKEGQPMSYYCYLAAFPAAEAFVDTKPVEEWIQEQLVKTYPNAHWEDVKLPTQAGQQTDWKMITVKGVQPFFGMNNEIKSIGGSFDLYTREVDGTRVLIGWRYPEQINTAVSQDGRLSAGSVVGAAPAPANPPAAG